MSDVSIEPRAYDAATEERALADRVRELLDLAAKGGADETEVYGTKIETISVRYEKGDMKLTQVDEGSSLGVRVFRDRKVGFSSTNQTDEAALATTAADANTLAGFSVADEANVLPGARDIDRLPPLVTPELAAYDIEEAVDRAQDFVARTIAVDPRLSIDQASFSVHRVSHAIASTAGVSATESDASLSTGLFGMAIDGDDVGGFDYWGDCVRDVADLDASLDDTIERFTSAALGNLGAGAAETYRGPVLFSGNAFLDVFVSPLVSAASSIAVQRERSWLAGKVGEAVAHPSITVTDDPTDLRLGGAASFDREGMPARPFALVSEGVLSGLLYNAYSARVDGVESTGHASGGARSVPGLGTHALSVAAGDGGSSDAMLARLGKGLLVQRFSGTVDPASGDFSGVAKSARWVEGGRVVRSVRETLFSGNAFELLGKILALSSERDVVMGTARSPWALVDDVSVTAG